VTGGDAVTDLVGFARLLRSYGLAVDPARVATALRALGAYPSLRPDDIYWATRLTLCSRREDVPGFDAAYDEWLGRTPSAAAVAPTPRPPGEAPHRPAGGIPGQVKDETDSVRTEARAGNAEHLAQRSPWTLSASDRAEVTAFTEAFTTAAPLRRTLRLVPGGRKSMDVPRTARAMMSSGCEPVRLWYRRRAQVCRRLVVLLDVSLSMRDHRERLLRFAYAAVAAAPSTTEVFTAGTRLDRITPDLRARDPQAAMRALADRRSDWDAGTRLGATVTAFARVWGGHRVVRAANLVIVSDGWEQARPELLAGSVARLSRLAHRVIWADPEAGAPGYVPAAPGLVDSLPFVQLVAAHDVAALRSLAELLGCPYCGPRCPRHQRLSLVLQPERTP
jgi:uncharacterized protein with von Willebrand factor type A (vWA) domain